MGMNAQLHLYLESELLEKLKKEAEAERISISELCRNKLGSCSKLTKIEFLLESISKRLNTQINTK